MNLDEDCPCCFAPQTFCEKLVLDCDEASSRECCFGYCTCVTNCWDSCCRECVWCGWLGNCARPILEEVCPDTTGALADAQKAEPCTACGHLCVGGLRCLKNVVCCASETLTRTGAILQALFVILFTLASAWAYYWYYMNAASYVQQYSTLTTKRLREVAMDVVRDELANVTLG
jgi:hypothetical protein